MRRRTVFGQTPPSTCAVREREKHVLKEHEVGALASLFAKTIVEAFRELHAIALVVHGERRIGEDAVEIDALPFVVEVRRVREHVGVFEERLLLDAVEDHVHLAHGFVGFAALLDGLRSHRHRSSLESSLPLAQRPIRFAEGKTGRKSFRRRGLKHRDPCI